MAKFRTYPSVANTISIIRQDGVFMMQIFSVCACEDGQSIYCLLDTMYAELTTKQGHSMKMTLFYFFVVSRISMRDNVGLEEFSIISMI